MMVYMQYDDVSCLDVLLQAFLWLPRQREALHEDLSVQSSDGQKVRLLPIDAAHVNRDNSRLLLFDVTEYQGVGAWLQLTKLKSIAA